MNILSHPVRFQLRPWRFRAGLTQERIAELASLSTETVQRIERKGSASPRTISCLAKSLGISVSDMLQIQRPLIIPCMSEKGGVGRTMLTFNLSVLGASLGKSVCAVQIDDQSRLHRQSRIERRRKLPRFSSCIFSDPFVVDEFLKAASSFSHILIDGTRYRPDFHAVLIQRADVIVIPVVNAVCEAGNLDLLMSQIEKRRGLSKAPILIVFNLQYPRDRGVDKNIRMMEYRYGRAFPWTVITDRAAFSRTEDGSFLGPLTTPVLTPRARNSRKANQELENVWTTVEQIATDIHRKSNGSIRKVVGGSDQNSNC